MRDTAPKIYVDFDDVLCETGRELTCLAQRLHGRTVAFEELTSFDLGVAFGFSPAELRTFMIAANDPEVLSVLRPMDGAIEALRDWQETGYEIHVVTGRPPSTSEASRQWLESYAVPHTSLTFVDKYGRENANQSQVPLSGLSEIGFCFAIEDSPSLAHYLSDTLGILVAMLDRPWNRSITALTNSSRRVRRCRGWGEVVESFKNCQTKPHPRNALMANQ